MMSSGPAGLAGPELPVARGLGAENSKCSRKQLIRSCSSAHGWKTWFMGSIFVLLLPAALHFREHAANTKYAAWVYERIFATGVYSRPGAQPSQAQSQHPSTVFCNVEPVVRIRTAFLDFRYRPFLDPGKSEVSVVGISEVSKKLNRSLYTECFVTLFQKLGLHDERNMSHLRVQGRVKFENMKVEGWIHRNVPQLSYQQAFLYCILSLPQSWNTSHNLSSVELTVPSLNRGEGCAQAISVAVKSVIPLSPPTRASGIEICVSVFRPRLTNFDIPGMVSTWIQHYRKLGTRRIHLYVDNADDLLNATLMQLSNLRISDRSSLANGIRTGFINVISWPPEQQTFSLLWHTIPSGKRILVGDGKVFYWSQATAYNDCIYDAASRGMRTALLDFDDFLVGTPKFEHSMFDFPQHALSFAWIQHYIECKQSDNRAHLWEQYAKNASEWGRGPLLDLLHGSVKGMNGKALYDPWYVIDSGIHAPRTCINRMGSAPSSERDVKPKYRYVWCKVRRLNNINTGYYVAHLRKGNLNRSQCTGTLTGTVASTT
eukprot:m.115557 g.115557  ORF g.115557 m.115557 type:complete len:544 (-) comp17144_c0_seq1:153-1784(-)